MIVCGRARWIWFLWLGLIIAAGTAVAQQTVHDQSPITDRARTYLRITQTEVAGRRVELKSLKGARLFAGPEVNNKKAVPLIVHFHGAPWLIEYHICRNLPKAAVITVQLGAGSSVYDRPFRDEKLFPALIDEAAETLDLRKGWSSITLTGFSAGYGAVRAILRQEANFDRINGVLLLDGIHAGYAPDGKLLSDGRRINHTDLDSFVKFAKEAAAGRKSFVITHSEIFPGSFASTTECADYLLAALNLGRKPSLKQGPIGMQQLTSAKAGRFRVMGYTGNSASDHVDHLHAMPTWFKFFNLK